MEACIYALVCPITGDVRYVGKANDAAARLKSHLRDAHRRDTPVYRWIRKLAASGLKPSMRVLETVSGDWRDAERRLIEEYRLRGSLLNVADGGDEPSCPAHIRAENGRNTAKAVHGNPVRRRVWECKKLIAETLRYMRKHGHTERAERIVQKMRRMAAKHPAICGEWAAL